MAKFTVIYTKSWMSGSHHQTIVKVAHIETDDLRVILNSDERFGAAVIAVFAGHLEDVR